MNAAPTMPDLANDAQSGSHCVQRPCSVERTARNVIEHKLLTALDDESKVAILATKQDLEDMIFGLCQSLALNDWDKERVERCHNLRDGMQQLMREAFPPNNNNE
jgi:hypothetical protein